MARYCQEIERSVKILIINYKKINMSKVLKQSKKISIKNSLNKKVAQPDRCFWINHGPVVKDIKELLNAASKISDEQFEYHTKRSGNDFAKWVEEVLSEKACAEKIKKSKTRAALIKALSQYS